MFGHHKLLRDGAEAQAVVIASKYHATAPGQLGSWHVDLTVPFPDGTTGSHSCRVDEKYLRSPSPGDLVPVRYDAKDHSKITVDEPALKARHAAAVAVVAQLDADRAHRVVEAIRNSPPGTMEIKPLTAPDPTEDPRIGIARMSIRGAQRRGDLAEVNRLTALIVSLENGTFEPIDNTPRGAAPDRMDQLQKLADLHQRGALSDAEFATEKAKILGS